MGSGVKAAGLLAATATVVLLAFAVDPAVAVGPSSAADPGTRIANGSVNATAIGPDGTTYIGGFTCVGFYAGGFTPRVLRAAEWSAGLRP
jgi:hypothetical protein